MVKHLLRVNFTNPSTNLEKWLVEKASSFKVSDEAVSQYFETHILDVPVSMAARKGEAANKMPGLYGRNSVNQLGDILFVRPGLIEIPAFAELLGSLGYRKEVCVDPQLSDGGRFVLGENFLLASQWYEPQSKRFKEIVRETGLDVELYFVPSMTSICNQHIDCDYTIIDQAKIIYAGPAAFHDEKTKEVLETIAKAHSYELREYPCPDEDIRITMSIVSSKELKPDVRNEVLRRRKGVNAIVGRDTFLTGYISSGEREYLKSKGIGAVKIPLGEVDFGAGLECVYGEFNL